MLAEYKNLYETNANNIINWKSLSINDLCNLYLKEKNNNSMSADSYLSAIICKCWNYMNKTFYQSQSNAVTQSDCYDNMIDSIMYVLNKHVWLNPDSKLYNDPNGPYKALSIVLKSRRGNIQYLNNMNKRKINNFTYSLNALEENSSDSYYIPYYEIDESLENELIKFISDTFNTKQYLKAFILDAILYYNIYDNESKIFSEKKLRRHLNNINDNYICVFAKFYSLNIKEVKIAVQSINSLSKNKLQRNIRNIFYQLRVDKNIISLLKN